MYLKAPNKTKNLSHMKITFQTSFKELKTALDIETEIKPDESYVEEIARTVFREEYGNSLKLIDHYPPDQQFLFITSGLKRLANSDRYIQEINLEINREAPRVKTGSGTEAIKHKKSIQQ